MLKARKEYYRLVNHLFIRNEFFRNKKLPLKDGYEKWNVEKENIFKWCEAPLKKSNVKFLKALVIRFFRNPIKVIKVLWNEK